MTDQVTMKHALMRDGEIMIVAAPLVQISVLNFVCMA
jgi:hypothetical protein